MGIWLSDNRAVLDKLKKECSWEFMPDEEFIFRPIKTPFRGADVQFNYLNGSVFIDFRRSISGQLYLAIISFDCYGACDVAEQRELGDELTTLLDREWQKTTCDTDKLWLAMKEVIAINKDQIWSDALQDYGLLQGETMQYQEIMIRFGELSTKGKNKMRFINKLRKNIADVLSIYPDVVVKADRDRGHVYLNGTAYEPVAESLKQIFGIQAFSPVYKVEKDVEVLKEAAVAIMTDLYHDDLTFKIASQRSDHKFIFDSRELNHTLGDAVFTALPSIKAQMKNPDVTLKVEIREEAAYLSHEEVKGAGGLPVGTSPKGMLMLSGGIDSPVAGYLALKRGVEIEAVHFASPPYTSPGALKKAHDLTRKLTKFGGNITFIEVPFTEIQEEIKEKAPEAYLMTLTRRFMMRITDRIREVRGGAVIVNGESLGQVASQTLESMVAINAVTNTPVIRPVVTMDKLEIIELAQKIDTFDISIQPFEDCCTIFAPDRPKTNPKIKNAEQYEARMDVEALVERAVAGIIISEITPQAETDAVEELIEDLL